MTFRQFIEQGTVGFGVNASGARGMSPFKAVKPQMRAVSNTRQRLLTTPLKHSKLVKFN